MMGAYLGLARIAAEVSSWESKIGPYSDLTGSLSGVALRLTCRSARFQGLKRAHQMDLPLGPSKFSG